MKEHIEKLITLIRDEESVLESFLNCLNRQKEFIVQNNVEQFDETVREEEKLISHIRELEEGRINLVRSIAISAGAADDELTLTRLIELNLGENSEELKALKRTLAGLVGRIKRANRVNQYLIKRSLSFIQKNIDWFIDDGNLNVQYASDGHQKMGKAGRLLIDKTM